MKVDKLSASCQLKGSREVTQRSWAAPGTPLQVDSALYHKRFRFSSQKNNILQLPMFYSFTIHVIYAHYSNGPTCSELSQFIPRGGVHVACTFAVYRIFISIFNQIDAQNLFHSHFYFMPLHVSSTCAHHQEVKIALHSFRYHHTGTSEWSKITKTTHFFQCDDTGDCVMQFWPPDDEHMCSKHVDAWNKTYFETNFVHQVS